MTTLASTLCASALLLLGLSTASAQVGIGIQGGFINSNATYEDLRAGGLGEPDTDGVTAWTVGIPIELSLSRVFALQSEINLLRRGYDFGDGPLAGTGVEYTVVSVPVLAKLGYVGESFSIAGTFGPAFQYLASGSATVNVLGAGTQEVDIDFDAPEYEDFNRTAIYGILGAQVGIPIGVGKLIADGRYRFQLDDEDSRDEVEIRGRGFSATAGILFTLGSY